MALRALRADKKIVRGALALPVVPKIGSVELASSLPLEALAVEVDRLVHQERSA